MLTNPANPFSLSQEALDACAREPIHIPGSIQPYGVLLILNPPDLVITQVSSNSADILGREPAQLLGKPIDLVLSGVAVAQMRRHFASAGPGAAVAIDAALLTGQRLRPLLALAHHYDGLAFVELLPLADTDVSFAAPSIMHVPVLQRDQEPEQVQGMHTLTQQLTVLAVNQNLDISIKSFCQNVAEQTRAIAGYDRVMIYRFDDAGNGEVIAEARDGSLEPFLGLCYPASDIPPQARLLYLRNRVRALGDIYAAPAPLLPRVSPVTGRDPDLSYCLLRSFSPVHLEYLHNMGVRATLTVSIIEKGRLWGLIACHHHQPHWPSQAVRTASDLLSEIISMQITLRSYTLHVQATARAHEIQHDLLRRLAGRESWFATLAENLDPIREMLDADGAAVCLGQNLAVTGAAPAPEEIQNLVLWLRTTMPSRLLITDSFGTVSPSHSYLAPVASGLIALEIARDEGGYLLWFRREVVQTVTWGGNPAEKHQTEGGQARLRPRTSFAAWQTLMRGKARPWPPESSYLAESLRAVLVELVLELMTARQTMDRLDLLRIRRAVEASGEPLVITDQSGVPLFVNRAFVELTGYDLEGLREHGLSDIIVDRAVAAAVEEAGRSPEGQWQGDLDLQAYDGTELPVQLRIDRVRNDAGESIGQIRLYTDLRPRRRAEEERRRLDAQLFEAQKLESIGVLAGGIAHDFNNLLTAMLGHANLIRLDMPLDSPLRESVEQIEVAAMRAAELSRQMLAYAGRGKFITQEVQLSRLVAEMARLLKTAVVKTAVLRLNLSDSLPPITGDVTQLRQVVMNLITNASDAIGEHEGEIVLRTDVMVADVERLASYRTVEPLAPGTYVLLEVRDTGTGMDAATMARMFEPFFSTKFVGRGLGLAAVQGIVRSHGGALRVESAPGQGTTISVIFPVTASAPQLPPPPAAEPGRGAGQVVLVIDDDAAVRFLVQRILERGGYTVLAAEDGHVGVELLRAHGEAIAVVLLDLTMPRMSGLETHKALVGLRPGLPVLLCSGYSEEEALANFANLGLAGFVQKPFRTKELLAAIERALAPNAG